MDRIFQEIDKPSMWNVDFRKLRDELIESNNLNAGLILDRIYSKYSFDYKGNQEIMWGDKTPANTIYAHMIKKQFPNCKIIFLLRDPRAVISSLLDVNYTYYMDRLDHMLWRWKISLKKYEELSIKDPSAITLLKYEELVNNPEAVIKNKLNWLGLKYEEKILDNTEINMSLLGVSKAKHHQNLRVAVTSKFTDKWMSKLPNEISIYIKNSLCEQMNKYEYK